MKTLTNTTRRNGFTLIELLTSISIIITLASMLAIAVKLARESARRVNCAVNLRTVGTAIAQFSARVENGGNLPQMSGRVSDGYWVDQVFGYIQNNKEALLCPSEERPLNMAEAVTLGMKSTTSIDPWFDPSIAYQNPAEWMKVEVSYRGSELFPNVGGYGPHMGGFPRPDKTMLLDEAWDNYSYGPRLASHPSEVWPGHDLSAFPHTGFPSMAAPPAPLINWDKNYLGLNRHRGSSNYLMMDLSVKAVNGDDGPTRISHYFDGRTY